MKNLIFAAIATLSIGSGSAFAESGENYEWAYSPLAPAHTVRPAMPQAAASVARDGAVIGYSASKTYDMHQGAMWEIVNHGGG